MQESLWSSPWLIPAAIAAGAALLAAAALILASPVYKHIICLRYLFCGWKAVVPMVSALPAALGVFLLILVFAIMDGFANDTREMTRGTLADIIIDAHMEGIPLYDDLLTRLRDVPGVEAVTPVIQTYAVARVKPHYTTMNPIVRPCHIIGIRPGEKAVMGRFHEYMVLQKQPKAIAELKDLVARNLATPEQLDKAVAEAANDLLTVRDWMRSDGGPPRAGCIPGAALIGTPAPKVIVDTIMAGAAARILLGFLAALAAIVFLFVRQAARRRPGHGGWRAGAALTAIAALGLALAAVLWPVHPEQVKRKVVEDYPLLDPGEDLVLSTIPIRAKGGFDLDPGGVPRVSTKALAVVDYFKSNYWEADSSHVYVDFAVAQQMAGMEARPAGDDAPASPARATQIQVKIHDPADGPAAKRRIEAAWQAFASAHPDVLMPLVVVNTWEEQQKVILGVVQMERNITALMLGLMLLGFTILIGLISYVMAYIKSRDVGILKAVGARDAGVGSLFLGYGFIIGLLGTAAGLAAALLMLHHLDAIELWVNATFKIDIFPRQMYYFDHIPRHISPLWCTAVSLGVLALSTVASMTGGLLAALKQPVEALRYE